MDDLALISSGLSGLEKPTSENGRNNSNITTTGTTESSVEGAAKDNAVPDGISKNGDVVDNNTLEEKTEKPVENSNKSGGSGGPGPVGSQWGSFLLQAVSNVEQKLDQVLQEPPTNDTKPVISNVTNSSAKVETNIAPSAQSKKRLTMQERLALAVKASAGTGPKRGRSPATNIRSATPSSRVSSLDVPKIVAPTKSKSKDENKDANKDANKDDKKNDSDNKKEDASEVEARSDKSPEPIIKITSDQVTTPPLQQTIESVRTSFDSLGTSEIPSKISLDSTRSDIVIVDNDHTEKFDYSSLSKTELLTKIEEILQSSKTNETKLKEENLNLIERIDSMDKKLIFLAKESSALARKEYLSASSNILQKKLAEKDEKISLLLEEGQKLSSSELKYMTTIKKLRLRERDGNDKINALTDELNYKNNLLIKNEDKIKKLSNLDKKQTSLTKLINKNESELYILKKENDNLINELKLEKLKNNENLNQFKNDSLIKEENLKKNHFKEIEELKIQLKIQDEKFKGEKQNIEFKLNREIEKSKIIKEENQNELRRLENKIEELRARSEEFSTTSSTITTNNNNNINEPNNQLKLSRQIETLQSQYSLASENWQGIEANLLLKINSLEAEMSTYKSKEVSSQKKIRLLTNDLKKLTDKYNESIEIQQDFQSKNFILENSINKYKEQIDSLTNEYNDFNKIVENEKNLLKKENEKLQQEKTKLINDYNKLSQLHKSEYQPSSPYRKTSGNGNGTANFWDYNNNYEYFSSPQRERERERNSNGQVSLSNFSITKNPSFALQQSHSSSMLSLPEERETELPPDFDSSIQVGGDAFSNNNSSPLLTTGQSRFDNGSSSTAAAGAPIQLLGKMSTTIRRLEIELSNAKDEVNKLTLEKEEAGREILSLMKKNEEVNNLEENCKQINEKLQDMKLREKTALEMLGEKTEEVEELRADVVDLKALYRQQIQELVEKIPK